MAHRRDLAPGWTFNPPDRELTDVYLRREIDGQPIAASFMHRHVDVYSAAPEKLVEGLQHAPGIGEAQGEEDKRVWYFFTTLRHAGKNVPGGPRRMSRTIAGAADGKKRWWHSEGSLKAVKGSAAGGALQKLTYKVESASGSGGWLMTEYSIHGAGDLVLCKVYKTPRRPRPARRPRLSSPASSLSSSSSSCTTTAADLSGWGCKRKASGDHPEAPPTTQRKTQEAYVQMEEEVESYSARRQPDQDNEGFSFCTAYRAPQGDFHASASASSSSTKSVFLDLDAGVTVDMVAPQSAPGAFVEEDAGLGSGADSVDKIVLYESGVTVDDLLDDTSNDGFQEPAPAPPCRNEVLSAAAPPSNTSQNELLHAPASNTAAWNPTDGGCYGAESVDKIVLYDGEVTVDDLLDDTTLDGSNDDFLCQDQEPPAASPCRNELLSVAVARNNTTSPPAPSQNELLHAPASKRRGIRRLAVATSCYPPTFLLPSATRKKLLLSGRRPPASARRTQHSICSGVHPMVCACTESATRTSSYASCMYSMSKTVVN
ncbi:hypothetical protein CFC21_056650 [Triticum aestivum]|uniref:NAC domain-containing protein n=1 Tax=Triticum aestivum TaxID=4565 RepID=A0A9R1GI14_WHEAT|nr:hypothetical protein CFC21_056650 [Triticum aestivum]